MNKILKIQKGIKQFFFIRVTFSTLVTKIHGFEENIFCVKYMQATFKCNFVSMSKNSQRTSICRKT